MTKQELLNEFQDIKGIRIKFYEKSPYQKARFKPEFVESEAWIYTPATTYGYCITAEDYKNEEWRKEFFDMIREESKALA